MWSEHDNALTRTFHFKDFKVAFCFMTDVAEEAEHQDHPWWSNEYATVGFRLGTHSAGRKVTRKDHQLAAAYGGVSNGYRTYAKASVIASLRSNRTRTTPERLVLGRLLRKLAMTNDVCVSPRVVGNG